jgi:hypothetical protein
MKEDRTEIDIYDLHNEWAEQGKLRRIAGEELGDVQDELRNKKTYIKHRRSQIALEYRTGKRQIKDENDKVIKLTEGALSDILDSNRELFDIDKEINNLQKKVDICSSYCTGLDNKKYGLQDEVKLFLSGYFSEPVIGDINEEERRKYTEKVKEVEKEISDEEAREKLREKRRRKKEE